MKASLGHAGRRTSLLVYALVHVRFNKTLNFKQEKEKLEKIEKSEEGEWKQKKYLFAYFKKE